MNKLKDALDSRLKDITFSQQMKNKVLEESKQPKKADYKGRQPFGRTLVPITLFLVFCISIAAAFKGLEGNELVEEPEGEIMLLEDNKVFSRYDVTGDGEADNVKIEAVEIGDEQDTRILKIFVNDKMVFEQERDGGPYWNVELIKLANGKVFFEVHSAIFSDDDVMHQLYTCENGELKSVYDFQAYFGAYEDYATYYSAGIEKISGNTLKLSVHVQFYTTGSIRYNMNLDYKDGKFESISNAFTPKYKAMSRKNKWTANKKIDVYEETEGKKVAYTLKKGNIVKLDKIIYKDEVYFQVENDKGEIGYIAATKTFPETPYFKEAQYAG